MPLASLLRDRILTQRARGGAELDWSALSLLAARDACLWLLKPRQRCGRAVCSRQPPGSDSD